MCVCGKMSLCVVSVTIDPHITCALAPMFPAAYPWSPLSSPVRFLNCKEDNADKFFTPAQRSMIVWDILQRVPYGDKEEQYGKWVGQGCLNGWGRGV